MLLKIVLIFCANHGLVVWWNVFLVEGQKSELIFFETEGFLYDSSFLCKQKSLFHK